MRLSPLPLTAQNVVVPPADGSSRTPTPTRSPVTRRGTLAPPYKVDAVKCRGPRGRTYTCRLWRQVRDLIIAQSGRTPHPAFQSKSGSAQRKTSIPHFGQLSPYPGRVERAPHSTTHGTRADLQTAGLNGVFAHFCRRGQKWVALESEILLTAVERNGAAGGSDPSAASGG